MQFATTPTCNTPCLPSPPLFERVSDALLAKEDALAPGDPGTRRCLAARHHLHESTTAMHIAAFAAATAELCLHRYPLAMCSARATQANATMGGNATRDDFNATGPAIGHHIGHATGHAHGNVCTDILDTVVALCGAVSMALGFAMVLENLLARSRTSGLQAPDWKQALDEKFAACGTNELLHWWTGVPSLHALPKLHHAVKGENARAALDHWLRGLADTRCFLAAPAKLKRRVTGLLREIEKHDIVLAQTCVDILIGWSCCRCKPGLIDPEEALHAIEDAVADHGVSGAKALWRCMRRGAHCMFSFLDMLVGGFALYNDSRVAGAVRWSVQGAGFVAGRIFRK